MDGIKIKVKAGFILTMRNVNFAKIDDTLQGRPVLY